MQYKSSVRGCAARQLCAWSAAASLLVIISYSLLKQDNDLFSKHAKALTAFRAKPRVELFIGALSAPAYLDRRLACRRAWADAAQVPGLVSVRFFVSGVDADVPELKDQTKHEDIVMINGSDFTYFTISISVMAMFRHACENYDFAYVLKTDDDSFVNVPGLLQMLQTVCDAPPCHDTHAYIGAQLGKHIPVEYGPNSNPKARNDKFWEDTEMATYPMYMAGGGYVVSSSVVRWLFHTQDIIGIRTFTSALEDAIFGFYFSMLNLTRIDSPRFWTLALPCCFTNVEGSPLQMTPETMAVLCTDQSPLVAHKLNAEQILFWSDALQNCSAGRDRIKQQL